MYMLSSGENKNLEEASFIPYENIIGKGLNHSFPSILAFKHLAPSYHKFKDMGGPNTNLEHLI